MAKTPKTHRPAQRKEDSSATDAPQKGRELFTQPATIPVRQSKSERYATVYTNNVQVGVSYYDIRFHFNEVLSATKELFEVQELLTVVMSPEHAKDLYSALGKSIENFEKKYGALRHTPKPLEEPAKPSEGSGKS